MLTNIFSLNVSFIFQLKRTSDSPPGGQDDSADSADSADNHGFSAVFQARSRQPSQAFAAEKQASSQTDKTSTLTGLVDHQAGPADRLADQGADQENSQFNRPSLPANSTAEGDRLISQAADRKCLVDQHQTDDQADSQSRPVDCRPALLVGLPVMEASNGEQEPLLQDRYFLLVDC